MERELTEGPPSHDGGPSPVVTDGAQEHCAYTRGVTVLTPGVVSPRRSVPPSIPRPEYVDKPAPARDSGPEVKDAETI